MKTLRASAMETDIHSVISLHAHTHMKGGTLGKVY